LFQIVLLTKDCVHLFCSITVLVYVPRFSIKFSCQKVQRFLV